MHCVVQPAQKCVLFTVSCCTDGSREQALPTIGAKGVYTRGCVTGKPRYNLVRRLSTHAQPSHTGWDDAGASARGLRCGHPPGQSSAGTRRCTPAVIMGCVTATCFVCSWRWHCRRTCLWMRLDLPGIHSCILVCPRRGVSCSTLLNPWISCQRLRYARLHAALSSSPVVRNTGFCIPPAVVVTDWWAGHSVDVRNKAGQTPLLVAAAVGTPIVPCSGRYSSLTCLGVLWNACDTYQVPCVLFAYC